MVVDGNKCFLFFFVFFFGTSRKTFWHRWKKLKVQENVGLNSRWSLQRGLAWELLNLVAISVHLKALSYLFCVGQPPGIFSYLPTILSFLDTNVNTTPLYLQPEWTINERNRNWYRVYISKIILTFKFALCMKEVFTYLYSFPCLRKAEKIPSKLSFNFTLCGVTICTNSRPTGKHQSHIIPEISRGLNDNFFLSAVAHCISTSKLKRRDFLLLPVSSFTHLPADLLWKKVNFTT